MGKKDQDKGRLQSVLDLLKKQTSLTVKQEKFCNDACVERFLKAKGYSVKKATKHLRNCLAWRDSIAIENLIADEFSAELAEGVAYVAGLDDESRPVLIFRIKQDYSQKLFTRLVVFTLEVALQIMPKNVDQLVILFDASFFRSASAFTNVVVPMLKILADYYPARLHRAFLIDPPSLFSYLWKGVKPFLELSSLTSVVSSLDYEDLMTTSYPRSASMRFDPKCSSTRFSFTVSHHCDSLKPWHLSLTDTKVIHGDGPAISPHNARSFSFASPVDRRPRGNIEGIRKGFFPSTPMPQKTQKLDPSMIRHPRTPKPSFLHSPALFFQSTTNRVEKSRESFVPFLKFYRRPYDEMIYRSKMRPPLGGLISIISPQIRRRHMSLSQRF